MIERKCPSCGAMVPFRTSISLYAVCPFCRALALRKDLDLEALGQSAQLQADGTPLQLGARGRYRGAGFEVVGRMQLKTPLGFWNEWFILFEDGRQGWLGETQGAYAVSFETPYKVPLLGDLSVLAKLEVKGRVYQVLELVRANYLAAEGELPFKPPLGETVDSADLIGENGTFGTIDYSEDPPAVFTGEYQDYDALAFTGVKEFEDWK